MSLSPGAGATARRVAVASGAGALGGAALLFAGRLGGSAAAALLLACGARAAASAGRAGPGSVAEALAAHSLLRQALFAPAWVLVVVAGLARAGSADLADVRGANAVAGLAVVRGSALAVAGAWLALAAGVLALAGPGFGRPASGGPRGRRGIVRTDPVAVRLEAGALVAQGALLVTLFSGPQVTRAGDLVPWVLAGGMLAGAVLAGAALAGRRRAPLAAGALAAAALALVIAGGAL
ncbi:MAG: hypothetical protein HY775_13435 [Acidobacteria bacterium]|nr:hypothetical protein [Acidobacteriota bacterium]